MDPTKGKIFRTAPAETVVRALACDASGELAPVSFAISRIDHVAGDREDKARLVLHSGLVIHTQLSYGALEERIFFNAQASAERILDLTDVCVAPVEEEVDGAQMPQLSPAQQVGIRLADTEAPAPTANMRIETMMREYQSNNVYHCKFFESDVKKMRPETGTRAKKKESILFEFNSGSSPQPGKALYVDMKFEEYVKLLSAAKNAGVKQLDLVSIFAANPDKFGFNPS